jgi:hypothetical protein
MLPDLGMLYMFLFPIKEIKKEIEKIQGKIDQSNNDQKRYRALLQEKREHQQLLRIATEEKSKHFILIKDILTYHNLLF